MGGRGARVQRADGSVAVELEEGGVLLDVHKVAAACLLVHELSVAEDLHAVVVVVAAVAAAVTAVTAVTAAAAAITPREDGGHDLHSACVAGAVQERAAGLVVEAQHHHLLVAHGHAVDAAAAAARNGGRWRARRCRRFDLRPARAAAAAFVAIIRLVPCQAFCAARVASWLLLVGMIYLFGGALRITCYQPRQKFALFYFTRIARFDY